MRLCHTSPLCNILLPFIYDITLNVSRFDRKNSNFIRNNKKYRKKKNAIHISTPIFWMYQIKALTLQKYEGRICGHADLAPLIQEHPCALAYALALVNTTDHRSITPAWVLYNFPEVEHIIELLNAIKAKNQGLFSNFSEMSLKEVEEALLFLSQIGALKLEGGFLVLYNAMDIQRLKDNRLRYKQEEYRMLNEFYKQKMQQIHIVGEYANLMVKNYQEALQYVQDYFLMDYQRFIAKYFKGEEAKGYQVTNAKVRFIVAWKPKDAPKDEKESAIPLIDLTMTRKI